MTALRNLLICAATILTVATLTTPTPAPYQLGRAVTSWQQITRTTPLDRDRDQRDRETEIADNTPIEEPDVDGDGHPG